MEKLGTLKVDKIVEHKDGSATIYFSGITKELRVLIKKIYKKKRFTDKLFRRFVVEGVVNYCKEKHPELMENEDTETWIKEIEKIN